MTLVAEKRNIQGAIRCPYHSWCYGLDGRLVATPHVGGPGHNIHPEIKRQELGLMEVKSYVYFGVIFVNIGGHAPHFETAMHKLKDRWQEFEKPMFHGGIESRFILEVKCNWKLAVENYCESYHLPWIHPGLNAYSRLEDHYNIEQPNHFSGQGSWVYRQIKGDDGTFFPDFAGLSDKWDTAAEYLAIYPNVLFGVHRDHIFTILLIPTAMDETREIINLYYADKATKEPLRKQNAQQWKQIFEEDIFVVEGMQKGRYSVNYDGGKFSPAMDGPTHCFHSWVANCMMKNAT